MAIPVLFILVQGWRRRWVSDDAFIDFRIVGNIVHGHGPVFNVGERVETYTDPLWVFILTCARAVWFVPIEWEAVLLGIAFTCVGVFLAGAAARRLGSISGEGLTVPIGMVIVVCTAAMWDFTTSGLETGLNFAWLGASWWALGYCHTEKRRFGPVAILLGLGPLIRPDLAIVSAFFVLALIIQDSDPEGLKLRARRAAQWIGLAIALPVLYQLFRMAYFALVVPNTALAKSAGTSWWSQGWIYLKDTVGPYWLWIPLVLLAPVFALELRSLWRTAGFRGAAVVAAPLVAGLVNAVYVVKVGGDFMHARMLLPALFAMSMPLYCQVRRLLAMAFATGAATWGVLSVTTFQYVLQAHSTTGIVDERAFWIHQTKSPHPITITDWSHGGRLVPDGDALLQEVSAAPPSSSGLVLVLTAGDQSRLEPNVEVPSGLFQRVVVEAANLGVIGFVAGPHVFLVDEFSLANPISSHFALAKRGRPGHEKRMEVLWLIARFVPAGTPVILPPGVLPESITNARMALSCGPLHTYLNAITRPMSFGLALSNMVHAVGYSELSFDGSPIRARQELCGS